MGFEYLNFATFEVKLSQFRTASGETALKVRPDCEIEVVQIIPEYSLRSGSSMELGVSAGK
jgi:hypothetical protein